MAAPDVVDPAEIGGGSVIVGDDVEPLAVTVPVAPRSAGQGRSPRVLILRGFGFLVVGIAAIVVATLVLSSVTAVPRVACGIVGLYGVFLGLDSIGKAIWGPRFDTSFWLAASWVTLLVVAAAVADLLPLKAHDNVQAALKEPSLARPDLFSAHPLGTDKQGLDLLASAIYGARVSLLIGTGAVLIGMAIGSSIGITAGFYRKRVDGVVSLLADAMLAFPPLILLLAMVTVLEPSTINIMIALAILGIPTYIRLSRANTLVFAQREFVLASRALGAKGRRIIFRELLPNVFLPILSFGFIVIGALIVAEAGLSFLGLGIQRPRPTWGNMILGGQANFERQPHVVVVPGMFLFLTVFSFNRIGEKARKIWDPRGSRL